MGTRVGQQSENPPRSKIDINTFVAPSAGIANATSVKP